MRLVPRDIELPAEFGEWILSHRLRVLCIISVVTVMAGLQLWTVPFQTALLDAFVDDPTELESYRKRVARFGSDADDLVWVATDEGESLFSPEKLNAIRNAARQLEEFPEIQRVDCLPDAYWTGNPGRLSMRQMIRRTQARRLLARGEIEGVLKRIRLRVAWPKSAQQQKLINLDDMKQGLTSDELLSGMLVSPDGTTQVMTIQLVSYTDVPRHAQLDLSDRIEACLHDNGLGERGVYTAGLIVSQGWMLREIDRAFLLYFPVGMAIICLVVYLIFQRLAVVLITVAVGITAILWGVGATALVFGKLSIMVAAAPLVILVISTSDVVHLSTAYKLELARGLSREEALKRVMREVGGACVLTSATTFIGFLSLGAVPAPSMRHFAVSAAVGVASALLLALTVVPIVYSYLSPLPTEKTKQDSGVINGLVQRFVLFCQHISLSYSRTVFWICAVLLVAGIYSLSYIHVDADFPKRFSQQHPLRRSVNFFNEHLSGTTVVEVFLKSETLVAPETLHDINRLEKRISELPEVTAVQSITMLYRAANTAFGFDVQEESEDRFPNTKILAESCIRLFRELDAERVDSIITPQGDECRISVRLQPSGYMAVTEIAEKIDQIANQEMPDAVDVESTGSYPIVGRIVRVIVRSQFTGLAMCLVSVTVIMALGLRSVRNSILAQLPNILPGVLLLAILGLLYGTFDTEVLGIPTVALGIAVDDTIHFLHRYRLEQTKSADPIAALERTFPYTGRAILQTTLILCLGLAPFALSGLLSVWMLGTYLVFALVCAVLGDLLLLPAMIKLRIIRW